MGLETATYISGLVATNPVGATDPKSQGDDHLRLIKSTLLATFPNITGAVTPTHTELNYVDGVTSAIQTQLDGKAATSHVHSAADLTSGTIPDARFPSTLPALNGSALTNLNASNLASGSVADARLSANVPLLNAANTYTGVNSFSNTYTQFGSGYIRTDIANTMAFQGGSSGYAWRNNANTLSRMTLSDAGVLTVSGIAHTDWARLSQSNTFTGATQTINNAAAQLALTGSTVTGKVQTDDGGTNFYVGTTSAHRMSLIAGNSVRLEVGSTGNFDFKGGAVTTNNASASEVGKTGAPSRTISASTNTAASDQGGTVRMTGGSGQTFTLDSDVPADCVVVLDNASGNSWTIAASGTLTWATTGGTGSRTLANGGLAVALSLGSGNYKITGGGLS